MAVIEVQGLEKTYANGTRAVRGIDFAVEHGEIFGLLGPNGAGKSTTIGVLGTLVKPTGGTARVGGIDVRTGSLAVRRLIGFAMQEAGVDGLATGREFLILQGRLYGLDKASASRRAQKLLRLFDLEDAGDKRIAQYSGGMKRRIDLAAALIHLPKIVFLDEPTEGLDPRSRRQLWRTLKSLRDKLGATVLLSTHYMEEADHLCDRLAIVDDGKIVAMGSPAELKQRMGGQSVVLAYGPEFAHERVPQATAALDGAPGIDQVVRTGRELHVIVADAARAAPQILKLLDGRDLSPSSLSIHKPTLDDVYLRLTGKTLAAAQESEVAA